MTEIEPVLIRLGLEQYLHVLVAEGFDTLSALRDIQESDLEYLKVKLGHRRKLQRATAEWRGVGNDKSLDSQVQERTTSNEQHSERSQESVAVRESTPPLAAEQKRKYRRHPKPDDRAPEKSPSAYVLFSNKVREEIRTANLSFTEIARLVGHRWQQLQASEKDEFDSLAAQLKEKYNAQLNQYRQTDEYNDYNQYLADFKAKQSRANETKKTKMESNQSSMGSTSSPGASGDILRSGGRGRDHARGMSTGSASAVSGSAPSVDTSAMSMQGVVLPHPNEPMMQRTSSPYHNPADVRSPALLSSQSSLSEDSYSAQAEHGDAPSRATTSSLITTPTTMVGQRTGRTEYQYPATYGTASTRRVPPNYPTSIMTTTTTTTTSSPVSSVTLTPIGAGGGDWWRDRGRELTRVPPGGGTAAGTSGISSMVASSPEEEGGSMVSRRSLPLPRQLHGIGTPGPFSIMEGGSTPESAQHEAVTLTPMRGGRPQGRTVWTEDDAADTLAGLSDRTSGAYHSWQSRTQGDQ